MGIVRPSVRLHSGRPVSRIRALEQKSKRRRRAEIDVNVPRAGVTGVPSFTSNGQRSSLPDVMYIFLKHAWLLRRPRRIS